MGSVHKVVGVKKVEQDPEAWDHSMPLPGDIIEGIAATAADNSFMQAKGWSELTLVVARIIGKADCVWLKVRRGDISVKMRVFIIPQNRSKLQKRVKIRAAYDENHVAVISELTFEECTELQEMSRRVVNMESARGFNQMPLQYDWRLKVRTYLPDPRSTVISSILFMPLPGLFLCVFCNKRDSCGACRARAAVRASKQNRALASDFAVRRQEPDAINSELRRPYILL
nr:Plant regulator RWP-RK [Ipomoea batatas]